MTQLVDSTMPGSYKYVYSIQEPFVVSVLNSDPRIRAIKLQRSQDTISAAVKQGLLNVSSRGGVYELYMLQYFVRINFGRFLT
jgi:hypothetical protein